MENASQILITGASGLVGKAILESLSAEGNTIKALVYNKSKIDSTLQNVEWIVADILDVSLLNEAMKGVSEVYHCLDFCSFLDSDANLVYDINISGTENVVNVCLSNKISKLIYVSSTQSFGTYAHKKEISEETKWIESKKNTLYAVCKNRAEMEVWRGKEEGLKTIIVNPSLIVAPKNDKIYNLKNIVDSNYKFQFEGGNGFVVLDDVAKICIQLMRSEISGKQFILSAENLTYDKVYQLFAASEKTPTAFKRMNKTKANIISRINHIRNIFFGTRTFLSKEILSLNTKKFIFKNDEIVEALDYRFSSVADYIQKIK